MDNLLSLRDKQRIMAASFHQQAAYWNELNTWGWPEDLLPSEAPEAGPMTSFVASSWNPRRTQLMQFIERQSNVQAIINYLNTPGAMGLRSEEWY